MISRSITKTAEVVKRDVFHVTWDADAAEKEGYEHFMLKEIHEQPKGNPGNAGKPQAE